MSVCSPTKTSGITAHMQNYLTCVSIQSWWCEPYTLVWVAYQEVIGQYWKQWGLVMTSWNSSSLELTQSCHSWNSSDYKLTYNELTQFCNSPHYEWPHSCNSSDNELTHFCKFSDHVVQSHGYYSKWLSSASQENDVCTYFSNSKNAFLTHSTISLKLWIELNQ